MIPSSVLSAPAVAPIALVRRPARRSRSFALALVGLAVLMSGLAVMCISLLSAARAYVGGESQWSRSQKSAVQHLLRFSDTRDAHDWDAYREAIAVNLGDRRAREELDKPEPDLAVVREGFLTGANHPDDVPGMIRLYRWFGRVPFMAEAIDIWAEADGHVAELTAVADSLRDATAAADAPALQALRLRLRDIDARLTPLEQRFSATLGEASRTTQRLLVVAILVCAAALTAGTLVALARAARRDEQQALALAEAETRLHRAMVGSSDGFWEWDIGRDRAFYSPRFETLLGHAPGSLPPLVSSIKALLHPDDVALARAALTAHLERGEPYDLQVRVRHSDGQWRWVRSRGQAQRGPGPRDIVLSGSIVDITERRQAELALRQSETLFRSLWETTNDAVLIVGTDHMIRFANPAAHALLGHAPGTLRGQPLAVVQPPRMHAAHVAGVARYMRDASRHLDWRGSEITALHADGHEVPMEIRFAEFDLAGERHFVGFMRDITQRKRAEGELLEAKDRLEQRVEERTRELLQANQRLLELDRLKSQFLATMSHELRTPLNSILGFTTVLRQGLAGPLNEEQQRQLAFVQGSGQHLLELINDLLDVSRIESGRMEVVRAPFDFTSVADEAVAQLQPQAQGKGLDLLVQVPPSLPMLGDRRKVYQVLLNLAGNALKFSDHGEVRINARRSADGQRLEVEVSDTGIGIAAEHLGGLFEAFRQVDGSIGRLHEGTGLGLYLSRKLLHLMGGTIEVGSQPGIGSTFRFSLPLELPAGQADSVVPAGQEVPA